MIEIKNGISIIVPVYNGELFIEEAYANIINQKLSNFEIIFIDNNSTDDSVSKILTLTLKDDRIRFFIEKKRGASAARNRGIKEAKGSYIHFFDVDDKLFDGALLSLLDVLSDNNCVVSVFGKTLKISIKNVDLSLNSEDSNNVKIYHKPELGLIWLKHKSKLPGTPCFLHRKEAVEELKGFQEDLIIGEDAFFHVKLGNEFNIASVDRYILQYYRHESSTVSRQNIKVSETVFTYWEQTIKAYLPYCKSYEVSQEFKVEVLKQIYGSIGKMIVLTKGFKNRVKLKNKCIQEITPLKIPLFINIFLQLLIFISSYGLYKFYLFYILIPYLNLKHNSTL